MKNNIALRRPSLDIPMPPHGLWSLWDMLTFDAGVVIRALSALRELEEIIDNFQETEARKKTDVIPEETRVQFRKRIGELLEPIERLNLKVAVVSLYELRSDIEPENNVSYSFVADSIRLTAITLRREISLIKTFCIEPAKETYYTIDFGTFGSEFEALFPTAIYELDEAGKCLALSRATGAVFHLMRTMEVGIRAVSRRLKIDDPTKDAEKNWAVIIRKIKGEIDRLSARGKWNDKQFFLEVYASLDAVRTAWRNPTMHVETKYTDDEAEHIFIAVRGFMKKVYARMDERGKTKR
jgi:hypothetical protein